MWWEVVHVGVREARGHRRHLRILAVAFAEHEELHRDELRRLPGEGRHCRVGRVSPGTVTGEAGLRLLWDLFGCGTVGGKTKRGGKHHRRATAVATATAHFPA